MSKTPRVKSIKSEISDLQEELRLLKLENATIRGRINAAENRLKEISTKRSHAKPVQLERKVTLEEFRSLTGSKVRVVNPKTIKDITGTILKVGTLYVTIILPKGKRLRRIVSNLRLIQDEE